MKFVSLFIIILLSSYQVFAQEKVHSLNLYLPSVEFRFQDDSSQAQVLKTTSQISVGFVIFKNYAFGFEQSSFEEKTGNSTLSIIEKTTDTQFLTAYAIYDLEIQKQNHFKIWLLGTFGRSKLDVETQLNNSKINESNTEETLGLGVLMQLTVKSFLIEFDTRVVDSKNYNPQIINVSHLRFGYQIQF